MGHELGPGPPPFPRDRTGASGSDVTSGTLEVADVARLVASPEIGQGRAWECGKKPQETKGIIVFFFFSSQPGNDQYSHGKWL